MAQLAFPPVQFAPPYKTLSPSEAWHKLVDLRLGCDDWRLARIPSNPKFFEVGEAIDQAAHDISNAVQVGALASYANLPATDKFFAIPPAYFNDNFCGVLSERIFCFPLDGIVPPALDNLPILFLNIEFQNWLGSIGLNPLAGAPAINTSRQSASINTLFEHWRREAIRGYEAARDAVSDEFISAGRTQSGYHIRGLSEAAEHAVCEMLSKARALPIMPESYSTALANALALFADLAADVSAVAIGASGRMPTRANGPIADRMIDEGRARIIAKFNQWALEDQLRLTPISPSPALFQDQIDRAPSVKAGRPPSDDDIIAQAEVMKDKGMSGREIAKSLRLVPGFENVGTVHARDLIRGRWLGGRPKSKRAS